MDGQPSLWFASATDGLWMWLRKSTQTKFICVYYFVSSQMNFVCDQVWHHKDGKSTQTTSTDHLWMTCVRTIRKGLRYVGKNPGNETRILLTKSELIERIKNSPQPAQGWQWLEPTCQMFGGQRLHLIHQQQNMLGLVLGRLSWKRAPREDVWSAPFKGSKSLLARSFQIRHTMVGRIPKYSLNACLATIVDFPPSRGKISWQWANIWFTAVIAVDHITTSLHAGSIEVVLEGGSLSARGFSLWIQNRLLQHRVLDQTSMVVESRNDFYGSRSPKLTSSSVESKIEIFDSTRC